MRAYVEKTNNFENNVHSFIPIANSHYNEKDNKLRECEHKFQLWYQYSHSVIDNILVQMSC